MTPHDFPCRLAPRVGLAAEAFSAAALAFPASFSGGFPPAKEGVHDVHVRPLAHLLGEVVAFSFGMALSLSFALSAKETSHFTYKFLCESTVTTFVVLVHPIQVFLCLFKRGVRWNIRHVVRRVSHAG